jgi:hypothetical protein
MIKNRLFFSTALILLTLTISCASHPTLNTEADRTATPQELYVPSSFNWTPVCTGIERFDYENKSLPVRYHMVKIDLHTEQLELVCYPGKNTETVFKGMRTSQFAKKYHCVVAMNATPFEGKNGQWDIAAKLGSTRQLVGVHKIDGIEISTPVERYSALVFSEELLVTSDTPALPRRILKASLVGVQKEETVAPFTAAFGGFFTVLSDSTKSQFAVSTHDSRSGAGISKDGRFLYLLVVEGEIPQQSRGLSYPQCADIFNAAGCTDALEFDGGSSADLCINGKSVLSYPFTVVQANSFGFRFAK